MFDVTFILHSIKINHLDKKVLKAVQHPCIVTEMKDVLGTREYKGLSHLLTCFSKMYEANSPLTSSGSDPCLEQKVMSVHVLCFIPPE